MKSPFVRFSRFVRTSLTVATVGVCLSSGCRHVESWRRDADDIHEHSATEAEEPILAVPAYEESSLTNPINPDATEPPLVSLSEGDAFDLVPKMPPEVAAPAPAVAQQDEVPAANPPEVAPVVKPPVAQESPVKSLDLDEATLPSTESGSPTRDLFDAEPETPQPRKPAPTLKDLDDEFFPEQPETAEPALSAPKLELPPEPTPVETKTSKSEAETPQPVAKPEPLPKIEPQETASVSSKPTAEVLKPVIQSAPRKKPARPVEPVPSVNNEVISLDAYCDGLVFDSQGFGFVSHRDRIVKFSPTGETSVWTTLSSPKGHRIEPEGTHLVCDTERRAVLRLSFDGKVIGTVAKECNGSALHSPYDIAVDPKGGFYFTDPGYVQIKNPIGKVHFVDRSGHVSVVVAKIGYPTGVTFDAARQRLLVAESLYNRVLEFRLSEPGIIESHEVLVQLPKSGDDEFHLANLCLDSDGNLYVTQQSGKAVHVFDPQGRPLGRFSTGEIAPSSLALKSGDAAELFLTGELSGHASNGKVLRLDLGR